MFVSVSVLACFVCLLLSSNLIAATYTVGAGGGYDFTTITAAIAAAGDDDTIRVFGTITGDGISTDGITIDKSLTIEGQGTDQTYIQAAASEGTADRRVFTIPAGVTVILKDMTIRYGNAPSAAGGGIHNQGTLTVTDCIICNNSAAKAGAIYTRDATAVFSSTAIVDNSSAGLAGGIYSQGGPLRHRHDNINRLYHQW